MSKQNRDKRQKKNPYLICMGLIPTSVDASARCGGHIHEFREEMRPLASWEGRFYEDVMRTNELLQQGLTKEEVQDTIWDEACREQDTSGVKIHIQMPLCESCAHYMLETHGGEDAALLAILPTMITGNAILLIADRLTEQASILPWRSTSIEEKNILPTIAANGAVHIHLKGAGSERV